MITGTTKRVWEMIDYSKSLDNGRSEVQPGTYELERIPHPRGLEGNWLVLKGTTVGMHENAWRQWTTSGSDMNPMWDDAEIVLEEDGQLVPAPRD